MKYLTCGVQRPSVGLSTILMLVASLGWGEVSAQQAPKRGANAIATAVVNAYRRCRFIGIWTPIRTVPQRRRQRMNAVQSRSPSIRSGSSPLPTRTGGHPLEPVLP